MFAYSYTLDSFNSEVINDQLMAFVNTNIGTPECIDVYTSEMDVDIIFDAELSGQQQSDLDSLVLQWEPVYPHARQYSDIWSLVDINKVRVKYTLEETIQDHEIKLANWSLVGDNTSELGNMVASSVDPYEDNSQFDIQYSGLYLVNVTVTSDPSEVQVILKDSSGSVLQCKMANVGTVGIGTASFVLPMESGFSVYTNASATVEATVVMEIVGIYC
jgi:hypothetical protein